MGRQFEAMRRRFRPMRSLFKSMGRQLRSMRGQLRKLVTLSDGRNCLSNGFCVPVCLTCRLPQPHFLPHFAKSLGLTVVVADHLNHKVLPQPALELPKELQALGNGHLLRRQALRDGPEGFEGGKREGGVISN